MTQIKKVENFEKVREYIKNMEQNSITNYEVQQKIRLNYTQANKILLGLVEINELKYSKILKIYVKINEGI